jgi:hypothetical protein
MSKPLSSGTTFFLKFVFSGIFLGCSVWLISYWIIQLIRFPRELSPGALVFTIVWVVATTTFCYQLTVPLKQVSIDDQNLRVSNYLHEITIPLSEISQVHQTRFFNVRPVIVHMRSPTRFGHTIKFVPQTAFHWWWNEHPIVTELKDAVRDQQKDRPLFDGAS